MPKLRVLPHPDICPKGAEINARTGDSVLDTMLGKRMPMDHACEKSCACATCHVVVRQGHETLDPPQEEEADMLDKAYGVEPTSRLSCQARIGYDDLMIEIPVTTARYTGGSN